MQATASFVLPMRVLILLVLVLVIQDLVAPDVIVISKHVILVVHNVMGLMRTIVTGV